MGSGTVLRLALLLIVVQLSCVDSDCEIRRNLTDDDDFPSEEGPDEHTHFEHESILGNRDRVQEFGDLPPEQAKLKLRAIAYEMDDDRDGNVDKVELKMWILKSFESLIVEETGERFEDADKDGNKLVTWEEYYVEAFHDGKQPFFITEEHSEYQQLYDEEREIFDLADRNKDELLTPDEYARAVRPNEFPEMFDLIVNHAMKKKDHDGDGRITLKEFFDDSDKYPEDYVANEKERFLYEFDKNQDAILDFDELYPWVVSDNDRIADEEAEHLLEKADDNHDGKLSIDEIVNNYRTFVDSEATDYGLQLSRYRDEF